MYHFSDNFIRAANENKNNTHSKSLFKIFMAKIYINYITFTQILLEILLIYLELKRLSYIKYYLIIIKCFV